MNEIEDLQRAVLARMDESDRRAAEREKERKKRRTELRAKLRTYGLREVSSDELLASVERLSDTVDRNLRARQAKPLRASESADSDFDTSPEAMRAMTKKWLETWDRFFRLLEERLPQKRADEANG